VSSAADPARDHVVLPKTLAGQAVRCMSTLNDEYSNERADPGAPATIRQLRKHRGQLAALIEDAGRGKLSAPTALLSDIGHHLEAGARAASKSNCGVEVKFSPIGGRLGSHRCTSTRPHLTLPSGI
jgi:hypothetical protein